METYIKVGEYLMERWEFHGGRRPEPKENKARHKAVSKGQARMIVDERDFDPGEKRKIERKVGR